MNASTEHATQSGVSVNGLRKVYGEKVVLDAVDLNIREGEILALLGPPGAGKPTIVRILSTLTQRTAARPRSWATMCAESPARCAQ